MAQVLLGGNRHGSQFVEAYHVKVMMLVQLQTARNQSTTWQVKHEKEYCPNNEKSFRDESPMRWGLIERKV